jgi:multidrug efflux pump subunit AcrA (membrane-fusion protein)
MKSVLITLLTAAVITLALRVPTLHAQGMPPTLVEVGSVTTQEFHNQITLIGRSEAIVQSSIVSEVDGRVIAVAADEGVAVKAG